MTRSSLPRQPATTAVFDSYWTFAARRQEVFHRRVAGLPPPWTDDDVIAEFRFTNAYRASDRVSQYLIRHVAYSGPQEVREIVFRVLLFKLFNRISTWELLVAELGEIRADEFDVPRFDSVMARAMERGERLYSAAYIMPPAGRGAARKHTSHLELVQSMLADDLPLRLAGAASMGEAYDLLLAYSGIGKFLAYQLVTDLNYTHSLNFSEMDFVAAGPGAISGLEKCFSDTAGYSPEDLIRWTADRQQEEFASRGLAFRSLWGRPLQLIDCQNLYCETDKYARVVHPETASKSGRTRIKQRFAADPSPVVVWFPPKWGLNEKIGKSGEELDPALVEVNLNDTTPTLHHASEDSVPGQNRLFPFVEVPR